MTFCVLRGDGQFARLESFDADKMRCWDDARRVLCAGLYRAVGMDEQQRAVAIYPSPDLGWVAIVPGVEPRMVSEPALVVAPASAAPSLDPTLRALFEAETERLRAQTEFIRKQCAWMDAQIQALSAQVQGQGQIVVRPGGKPN